MTLTTPPPALGPRTATRAVNPLRLLRELETQYRRFYDSAYAFADPSLAAERRALMLASGLSADLILEPVPGYASSSVGFGELAEELALGGDVAEFVSPLFNGRELYRHQADALRAYERGEHVVVSAGTGSGKTEAFLVPVLTALVRDSRRWVGQGAHPEPWWEQGHKPVAVRSGETGRPAGMRALILYPMNALVEDQMVRLRRVLDGAEQLAWLDRHRRGHRFYFGRYTGQTPYLERELAGTLRALARRAAAAERLGPEYRPFIARPLGAELLTRPDMQAYPPDILITNFSMLNVMLNRSDEAGIFERTAYYLQGEGAAFHLVVDELHSYKGTAGTEVAMLLRRLLHRLRLEPGSPKLRLLAASASLGDDREAAHAYLEEFFGAPRASFRVLSGLPRELGGPVASTLPAAPAGPLEALGRAVLAAEDEPDIAALAAAALGDVPTFLAEHALPLRLLEAAKDHEGHVVAKRAGELASTLRPDAAPVQAKAALAGALTALAALPAPEDGQADQRLPMRAHLFFRIVPGWWACARADCPAVDPRFRDPRRPRTVGKLYAEPTIRCQCGARCLDLWACQTCGDHLLGGYCSDDRMGGLYLLPELPELERVPDLAFAERTYERYRFLWPRPPAEATPMDQEWEGGRVQFGWIKAALQPPAGRVEADRSRSANGWLFAMRVGGREPVRVGEVPAVPTRCPNCGDDRELRQVRLGAQTLTLPITSHDRMRSPISRARAGHDRVSQVLAEHLLRALYPDGEAQQLVAFSDSRQDAARLNASLDVAHHLDSVRALVVRFLAEADERAEQLRRFIDRLERPEEADREFMRLVLERSQAARALRAARDEFATEEDRRQAQALAERELAGVAPVVLVRDHAFDALLSVGRNPAGPASGLSEEWIALFDWSLRPPRQRTLGDARVAELREGMLAQVGTALFSGSGRDVESLGLGLVEPLPDLVAPPPDLPERLGRELVLGCLRVLGLARFYAPGARPGREAEQNPPKVLQEWLKAVEDRWGLERDMLKRWAGEALPQAGQVCQRWLVQLERCQLAQPSDKLWICDRCGWRHAHGNAGVCMHCRLPLPEGSNRSAGELEDYYAQVARDRRPVTRLHTEELTGQTERADAAARQARFQGVFLAEEPELPSGIDVLSVTTTMEAGVDIGSLLAVLMANVPPRRFNYQQRVGRAGRRGDPLAVALTVARERSHDQYSFQRPEAITTKPPPPPYLATDRVPIIGRVVVQEALRRAFDRLPSVVAAFEGGSNIHGHFGEAQAWPAHREHVLRAIADERDELRVFCASLLAYARAETTPEALLEAALARLDGEVTRIAALPNEQPDLSQRLAEHGLLPIFGFPTQVRYLFTQLPRSSHPWPPVGAIDRDLRIAVSEFAPGNEIVVDKFVYRAVGVVGFQPQPNQLPRPLSDPLGRLTRVGLCDTCKNIDEVSAERCRTCGDQAHYREVELCFPAGFRAEWTRERRRYESSLDRLSRASVPRVTVDTTRMARHQTAGLVVMGGPTRIYSVNDNHGSCFTFQPGRGGREFGLLERSHAATDWLDDSAQPEVVALGASLATDVLIAHAERPRADRSSHCLPEGTPAAALVATARRAAWTSLAFAFRIAAAVKLDVEVAELECGIRFIRDPGTGLLTPEIFLSDAIENGAGYVSLRDWTNNPYHPLLDWRLAADCLEILRFGQPRRDRWTKTRAQAVQAAVAAFPGWSCPDPRAAEPLIEGTHDRPIRVVHPLANTDDELADLHATVNVADVFNLNRRPGAIYLAI